MKEIVSIDQIAHIVQTLRRSGYKKIVFTNGCFDILHRGHVEYLEKARELGDLLVLGLNSDTSVKKLKGHPRPYVGQEDRAFILSRLEAVDIVCIFDEETPYELIKKVKPDVLVKGGDYNADDIVGNDIVINCGGQVISLPFIEGKSTSSLIEEIKKQI
jgi:rfaE bifunctional protein nucleotidyltransferase chain/domain